MTTNDIENVLTVLQGIGDRNPELAVKHLHPTKYTEHNPQVPDGITGVREWIDQLPREQSSPKIIRTFQDGPHVVTYTEGHVFGHGVFFDIFKLEEGLIVEHWAFSEEAGSPNKSGHTRTDGATESKDDHDTEESKSLVRDYYQIVHVSGQHDKIARFVSNDCIRHEPGVSDGLEAFLRDLASLTQGGTLSRSIDEIKILLARGDFVFVAARGTARNEPCNYVDLYRIDDAKIAERWGFSEELPPRAEWKNDNGVL